MLSARIRITPQETEELRHALIPGTARDLLAELAAAASFKIATSGSVSDSRMSDREMVLRFLAFRLFPEEDYASTDLDDFLRAAMRDLNELPHRRIPKIE